MKEYIINCVYRLKKSVRYRKSFILSFLLTYIITAGIAVISGFLELEAVKSDLIIFHRSQLTFDMYIWAKLIEAVIPTTITFSGVALLFQMSPKNIGTSGTFILISISLLATLYITISQIADENFMFVVLIIALILDVVPIAFACKSYIEPIGLFDSHKRETSDGLISGSTK